MKTTMTTTDVAIVRMLTRPILLLPRPRLRNSSITLGIGAGPGCDGQVLVTHDLLGMFDRFTPKFVKRYAELHTEMQRAFASYIADVQSGAFPAPEHTTPMAEDDYAALVAALEPHAD